MTTHAARKHAKFSPSGFERVRACPGSVSLSEGLPDKSSVASLEGTKCHEVMEAMLRGKSYFHLKPDFEMVTYARAAAEFIRTRQKEREAELLIETKVELSFIHPDFWGSLDAAVIDHFDSLEIIDLKYGRHLVSPRENLQLIAYALGVAHKYDWNFSTVRLTIVQPRAKGYDGAPSFWDLSIRELKGYVPMFTGAIKRALKEPDTYNEGSWCFFCKARSVCPLKKQQKLEQAKFVFGPANRG
jgi:hypothetical protein